MSDIVDDPSAPPKPRLKVQQVDAIRGLACLAVCLFHFTNADPAFPSAGWLRRLGSHGYLGVHVFFVVSGFVIALSLERSRYAWCQAGDWLLRRLVRLHPPYLAGLALALTAALAAQFMGGERLVWGGRETLLHLGLANDLAAVKWINDAYWSLAIEWQYYVVMAGIYPLLRSRWSPIAIAALAVVSVMLPMPALVFRWLPLFFIGWSAWQWAGDRRIAVLLLTTGTIFLLVRFEPVTAAVAVATWAAILWWHRGYHVLIPIGTVSYSLYLVHGVIGGRFLNRAKRFASGDVTELVLIVAAVGLSLAAAWALWKWVESPCQRMAQTRKS